MAQTVIVTFEVENVSRIQAYLDVQRIFVSLSLPDRIKIVKVENK